MGRQVGNLDEQSGYEANLGPMDTIVVPYARLEFATPVVGQHKPAAVIGVAADDGVQQTGTIINLDAVQSLATINVARAAAYFHQVRNVLTYSVGAETTFASLDVGIPVYYDGSSTMPAGIFLSLAALDEDDDPNPLFGYIALADLEIDEPWQPSRNPYPLGPATATSHVNIAISQA